MGKRRKFVVGSMAVIMATLLGACGNGETVSDGESNAKKTEITFWAAPNPTQLAFWEEMASKFEETNDSIDVVVSQMKESPSSEATIQSAVASGTAPTLSENINRSFGAQLADSEVLVPLNEVEGFNDIVSDRNMNSTIESWSIDEKQYILPMYSNPILFAWRLDILRDLGFNEPPKTYSQLIEVGKALKEKYPDKVLWAKSDLSDPTGWMRWFDFFPMYNAASEGNAFIEGNKFVADDDAGIALLELMSELQSEELLLTGQATDPLETGLSVMSDLGPWTFPNWEEKFPELKFGENYTITAPVVPDEMAEIENVSTYADAKGIVMYEQATDEERAAAMEFLQFVFSNVENDVNWLEKTSLIPARDDAKDNEAFGTYFEEHPEMAVYAENVQYAVPSIANADYNKLQQLIGQEAWNPVVRGEKESKTAWEDMKAAIEGALQ